MIRMGRREFLATGATALPAAMLAGQVFAAGKDRKADTPYDGFRMGSQSYSFRHFTDPAVAIAKLKELGLSNMEFCFVHFKPDAADPGFATVKALIASSGIVVPSYGVEVFGKDEAANRKKFDFAKALGLEIMTADIEKDAFAGVDKLCNEYNVKLAIHNHGPGSRYDKVADTLAAVKNSSKLIGACLDTGHAIRSGEKPHEVAAALGDRLISMHLKDWVHGGPEKTLGEGDMDLVALVKQLKSMHFGGPIMVEYEDHEDDPVPYMKKGLANWQTACDKA